MKDKLVFRASRLAAIVLAVPVLATSLQATGAEPGWAGRIVVTGQERVEVKSTPIEMRPYRPLHVYGNTVRRRYYHSTALPAPRKVLQPSVAVAPVR